MHHGLCPADIAKNRQIVKSELPLLLSIRKYSPIAKIRLVMKKFGI